MTRGRGRPAGGPLFDEATRQQFLDQVAAGAQLGEAAAAVGIHRNLPGYHARTDGVFARRLEEALARGKAARADKVPHGEYRYNVLGCRCKEICTPAASAARAGRRRAADADATREPDSPAPVRTVPKAPEPESPTSFLLRSRSSPPDRRAA
ncbi:hypothetical protein ACFY8X_38850 [Streptomyces tanashiensis]|uniref:hypothetical protein n=1 Tax=Streptomyces tanashiensis TaxID=67367 RepID=UPI0036EE43C6